MLFQRIDQQIEGLRQPQAFAGHTAFHVVEGTVEPGDLVASGICRSRGIAVGKGNGIGPPGQSLER